ncbi:protein-glutamate O-methyltransferase CheR [Gemmatimonas groenlandica]|uniref:protein-glutamate O-methyltransferase n=2 Tax=Gemmatimonas groenlandica TaxID=2732249 RepID=A0A6M4IXB0_9BACT|nr:protein-glutamate O-methyltransferase CheR [Gemmatimonas groenlandica]
MTDQTFRFFRTFAETHTGIVLDADKEYLVESRLVPVARAHGFASLDAMAAALMKRLPGALNKEVQEALTTNETSFFRDIHPFEMLRTVILPDVIARRRNDRSLTIWCAAASTGQEPFSVAMLIREHFPDLVDWKIKFIATDLSRPVLARAREGLFSQLEVNRGLPAPLLVKYFTRQGAQWQLREDIRQMVEFRELNLLERWPALGKCDVVMMRNVLIYFDVETKREILARCRELMPAHGYLMLGSAETTLMIDNSLRRVTGHKGIAYQLTTDAPIGRGQLHVA